MGLGRRREERERALIAEVAALTAPLSHGLADEEWEALVARADALLASGRLPEPSGLRPGIPWPPL